jgi:glycosyltransferase involved in cell wall biosynthesis
MRIVQAVGWYFPNTAGGTEVYVDELSRRLRRLGHDVRIAAPDPLAAMEREYDHHGVPVYRYPVAPSATRDEAQGRRAARGAERFHRWLERVRPDLVHMHTFVTGLAMAEVRAARAAGVPVVATTHSARLGFSCERGTLMRWGRAACDGRVGTIKCTACALHGVGLPRGVADAAALVPPSVSNVLRHVPGPVGTTLGMAALVTYDQGIQREMFTLVDRFVVLTEYARQVLLVNGAPPDRVAVNRLGVRFAPRRPGPRPGQPLTVAYIGRFDPIKGVEDFARAIAAVPSNLPLRFVFAGPVKNRGDLAVVTRLKAIVARSPFVTFTGELDAAGVEALLQRTDLVCCPSRVVEGGPTVALEAHAAGVPVIGTAIPGLSEIVTDGVNGCLVPPANWRALSRALIAVAGDPAVLDRWHGALGPVRTMDDVTRDYVALYEALS